MKVQVLLKQIWRCVYSTLWLFCRPSLIGITETSVSLRQYNRLGSHVIHCQKIMQDLLSMKTAEVKKAVQFI